MAEKEAASEVADKVLHERADLIRELARGGGLRAQLPANPGRAAAVFGAKDDDAVVSMLDRALRVLPSSLDTLAMSSSLGIGPLWNDPIYIEMLRGITGSMSMGSLEDRRRAYMNYEKRRGAPVSYRTVTRREQNAALSIAEYLGRDRSARFEEIKSAESRYRKVLDSIHRDLVKLSERMSEVNLSDTESSELTNLLDAVLKEHEWLMDWHTHPADRLNLDYPLER
ncbi:hypothetical protein [Rhodococcus rhodochrous]|uniref:hypothetical protein n=1 Tax=Rhodococcus rhodochrous TaxID=1829 RepID=UPI0017872E95|nr:hypothetical protein [Rhodococcus rhodochrous]